jgi:ribosomal protein S14
MTIKLQYQLSSGTWVDCGPRSEEFLARCEAHNGMDATGKIVPMFLAVRPLTRDEVLTALAAGTELRNHQDDWYSVCRDGAPAEAKRVAAEARYAEALAARMASSRRWGASGTRFDEACDRCGREGEVDNVSGLCRRCL